MQANHRSFQISDTQHNVDQSRYCIEVLERSLKMKKMPDDERCVLYVNCWEFGD